MCLNDAEECVIMTNVGIQVVWKYVTESAKVVFL